MRFLRNFVIMGALLSVMACNTYHSPTANIDRSVAPDDVSEQKPAKEAKAEKLWTPNDRRLMADIPPEYRRAVRAQFGNALEANPVLDWYDHGMEVYAEGDYQEAERSLLKVLEALPDFYAVSYDLGLSYYYQKKYREAAETFETLIAGILKTGVDDVSLAYNPELLEHSYVNLGMTYLEMGQSEKAIETFNKVMPEETAHHNLVIAHNALEHYPEVVELVDSYSATYREDAELRNLQGLAYYHQQQIEPALAAFQQAAQADPKDAQIQLNIGLMLLELKRYDEATAAFETAKALDPELDVDAYLAPLRQADRRQARIHYNQAVEYYQSGKLDAAITEWNRAIELYPDFLEAHVNLAAAYTQQRRVSDAVRHLEAAIKLDPKSFEAHYNLGASYSQLQRYEDAVRVLSRAVELRPEHAESQFSLGMAFYKQGKMKEALAPLRRATQLKPTWLDPWLNLGLILGRLDRHAEAIQCFKELLRYHPRNGDAYYNLGVLYLDTGKREDAIKALEQALDYDPMNTRALTMLEQLQNQ